MKGQRYITFPKEVTQFLTGDYTSEEEVTLPLFKELSEDEEAAFRRHARENYKIGDEISEVFHPVWADEARRMNAEAEVRWPVNTRIRYKKNGVEGTILGNNLSVVVPTPYGVAKYAVFLDNGEGVYFVHEREIELVE